MNSSQLTRRIQTRTVYADYIVQKERQAQGCASNTAYSPGGLDSSVLLEIQQGFLYTPSTTTAAILSNGACPGCNIPTPPAGPGSMRFIANDTSFLGIDQANNGNLVFGTNDFTIEWFQYMTLNSANNARVFCFVPWQQTEIGLSIEGTTDPRTAFLWYNGANTRITGDVSVLSNWHHLAIVGSGGNNLKLFLDGSNVIDSNVNYNVENPAGCNFSIGAEGNGSSLYDGYVTNFRVVNGTALYTSDFTVPSIPLSNVPNTQLLLLAQSSNTPFLDSSSNNYTVNNLGSGLVSWASNAPA